MTQRTWAGLLAVPLLIALWVVAVTRPLPYVTYEPGLTVDVLDDAGGQEIIQVSGAETYRDGGELRLTTVYVSQPRAKVNLFELMSDWVNPDAAVYPYQAVYEEADTPESNKQEGEVEMTSSQDAAIAVALTELGYEVTDALVATVSAGAPAEGRLEAGDVILRVDGNPVAKADQVVEAVQSAAEGAPVTFLVRRGGTQREVSVSPELVDGEPKVGIEVMTAAEERFPFDVSVDVDPRIGGPSAGLMFSLGIYDTLTPGSLSGGRTVAGTGTLDAAGHVGSIGGIQQKIAAAREEGAELFLVPPDNCAEALAAPNGDMRLVRVQTMHDAAEAIDTWADAPDAGLPSCSEVAA